MNKHIDRAQSDSRSCPLCVDLDGTLVNTDTLIESCLIFVRRHPVLVARWPAWLARGKARFKHEIACRITPDPATLPYNAELLDFLKAQKAMGRKLILVTAAHKAIAEAVAAHLNLFDEVLASDAKQNLKGSRKARLLLDRFGTRGFSYAGNDRHDIPVWKVARTAVLVNVSRAVSNRIPPWVPVERRFKGSGRQFEAKH